MIETEGVASAATDLVKGEDGDNVAVGTTIGARIAKSFSAVGIEDSSMYSVSTCLQERRITQTHNNVMKEYILFINSLKGSLTDELDSGLKRRLIESFGSYMTGISEYQNDECRSYV